ncbi:MAG: heat shock protein HtpX [Methanomassiliicoccales archaeon PtaU1.Bin124]|nr:MAG: heat shock protein HtpX [Methanomassiliicoccales archaeon PtaU1.Bin124]
MMAVMIGLFMAIGWLVGTYFIGNWLMGTLMFALLAGAINFISYFFSSKIVLWSYKARIVTEAEAPRLYRLVRGISQRSGLPMPKVAILPTQNPNAFATGRNPKNAVVAATEGILRLLDDNELEGVLAHEMAHVKNRDILVMSVAATVAGAISFAARMAMWGSFFSGGRNDNGNWIVMLLVAITAPIAAMLLQLAISRSREYKADYEGAKLIGKPLYLARALEKLEEGSRRNPMNMGSPTSSSLFIVNPFRGSTLVSLFSTHPPMEERIRRLKEQAKQMGQY